MALKVVQDTSTNWTPADWRILDRMKKTYTEMDDKSGRPWKLGDDLLIVAPPGDDASNSGRTRRVVDASLEVGCEPGTLRQYGWVSEAWTPVTRVTGVKYTVFRVLAPEPDRVRILKQLIKEAGGPDLVTVDNARRAIGVVAVAPQGLKDRVVAFSTQLDRFMNQRLYSADRLALEQLRLKIDILLGDAEEEAV